jgi:hypothetical protein
MDQLVLSSDFALLEFSRKTAVQLVMTFLTNKREYSPDSSGFGLQLQSFSETNAKV